MTFLSHMVTVPDSIEAAVARAGWRNGAEDLVARWVERRRSEPRWEATWTPRSRYCYVSESRVSFVIEWLYDDIWTLRIEWPEGWDHEYVRTGHFEDLKRVAHELAQADGPYGGPRLPPRRICALPRERVWRASGDTELRFEPLCDNNAAYFHISRDGALNDFSVCSFIESRIQEKIDWLETMLPSEPRLWATVQGKRRSWSFTTWRPILAHMNLGERELLLVCPEVPTVVILAHTAGHLQAAIMVDRLELYRFDTNWLTEVRPWPSERSAVVRDQAGPSPRPSTSPPAPTPRTSPTPSASSSPARTPEAAHCQPPLFAARS